MLKSKSKYFTFKSDYEIETNVIRVVSTIAICPVSFNEKLVQARVFYPLRCDFLFTYARRDKTRTYINLPVGWEGLHIRVVIVDPVSVIRQTINDEQNYFKMLNDYGQLP